MGECAKSEGDEIDLEVESAQNICISRDRIHSEQEGTLRLPSYPYCKAHAQPAATSNE